MEAGFKSGDQRQAREAVAEHSHGLGVRRIMGRRHVGEGLHRGQDRVVDQMHAGERLRMNRLEADGRDLARVVRARRFRGRSTGRGRAAPLRRGRRSARTSSRSPRADRMTTLAFGEPMRSIAPRASTGSAGSLMSKSRYLKLVLPRLATRTFNACLLRRRC